MKILFIDDYQEIAQLLAEGMHNKYGYDTKWATSGLDGLELIERFKPDVIFSDIVMPNMTGLEFCIKAKEITNAPFAFLTAFYTNKFSEVGAIECLEKPLSYQEIDNKIKEYANLIGKTTNICPST